jgi:hypothetical protein
LIATLDAKASEMGASRIVFDASTWFLPAS